MLSPGGKFSMTVGENLELSVGVEVLSPQAKSTLARSIASKITRTFLQNYHEQLQSSQCQSKEKKADKKNKGFRKM